MSGFPTTPLRWTAEAALGADLTKDPSTYAWTDITALVMGPAIVVKRGRASEFSTAPAATGTATMDDTDGRWVERNPLGVWYGLIGFNTPLRYLIAADANTAADTFTRTVSNGFGTADVGGAWAVNGTASEYSTTGTAARLTLATAATRRYAILPTSYMTFDVTVRIRTAALATGAALSAGILFHYSLASDNNRYEVVFNTDQSIGVRAVARVASVETAGATVVSGLTHVANTWYRVRAQSITPDARQIRLKVWLDGTNPPDTWTVHNTLNATLNPAAGKVGLTGTRETGNTNAAAVIEFDDLTFVDGPVLRHTGYIDTLPRRWADHSATVLYAPITASGPTRRLEQGGATGSAIRRGVLTAGVTPKAYWPGEDKSTSTQIASGLPAGLPMRVSLPMSLGSGQAAGSDPVVAVSNTGRLVGPVQPYVGTDWQVMWLINVPAAVANEQALLRWQTSGTYPTWQLVLTPAGGTDQVSLRAYDQNNIERLGDVGTDFTGEPYGTQLWIEVSAIQSGPDLNWSYTIWGASGKVGFKAATIAGTVTEVSFGNGSGANLLQGSTLGHMSVWDTAAVTLGALAQVGWAGETATTRMTRLGQQEQVPTSIVAVPTVDFATMGPPTNSTLISQLRECETVEQGILYDAVDGSIALLPRESRFNRPVALTLDVALGQVGWPFEPDNDDQQNANDVTSSQPTGSSYRYVDSSPARGVSKGHYSKPATVNVWLPDDLKWDAQFRTALGTVDEDRITTLVLTLTGNPSLIPAWLACDIGSRIQIINTSALFTPDPIDLIIEGYQETISSTDWTVTLYTSSAKPWNAWIVETGSGNQSKLDSGSSTLATGVNSTATSLSVATTDPLDVWTTLAGDFPFDIGIGGERMTVSTITGAGTPQTFTISARHVNGVTKAQVAGQRVGLWNPNVLAL